MDGPRVHPIYILTKLSNKFSSKVPFVTFEQFVNDLTAVKAQTHYRNIILEINFSIVLLLDTKLVKFTKVFFSGVVMAAALQSAYSFHS